MGALRGTAICKRTASYCWGLLLFIASSAACADATNALFLPSEVKSSNSGIHSFTTLSNEDLLIRANQMKYDELTASQRAMNYQWLSEHSGSEDAVRGNKAVSKLVERHLKAYIDNRGGSRWIKSKLMPDSSGNGFIKSVDYDVKLRSDKLVIGISYEF